MDGDASALRRLCWRDRESLPPWHGSGWYRAWRFYKRCLRKIRHARGEAPVSTPLFRS